MPQAWPRAMAGLLACALVAAAACSRHERAGAPETAPALPLRVLADTSEATRLDVPSAAVARAWLARVSREPPAAIAPPPPAPSAAELAPPESLRVEPIAPEALVIDDDLKPPIPRGAAAVRMPARIRGAWQVDLDVRVDEAGEVTDVRWAAGSDDSAAVRAAIECARGMRFHPALRAGHPVAVWCRQRFAFERGRALRMDAGGGD